jgi:hypothetical protein
MPTRLLVPILLAGTALAATAATAADGPVSPEVVSVNDMSRPSSEDGKNNVLCGMHIRAHAELASGSGREWEVAISVVTNGQVRLAGVSLGSFARALESPVRSPRAPAQQLSVGVSTSDERTPVHLSGRPNPDNGIVGQLPEDMALKLFDALDAKVPIVLDAIYESGDHEVVLLSQQGGKPVKAGNAGHGPEAPVFRCLAHLVAASPSGESKPLVEVPHATR